MSDATPRVFISYSHDSDEHRDRVLALANKLRGDGIDVFVDQHIHGPGEGWPKLCEIELGRADFVAIISTEVYLRRWNGDESPGVGHGVLWEARLIRQELFDAGSNSRKFVPVLFSDSKDAMIPRPIRGGEIVRSIETDAGYGALYTLLTGQHEPAPELGEIRRVRSGTGSSIPARPAGAAPVDLRAGDVFVGREEQLDRLKALLFPVDGTRRPVVVFGMPGVGKSYLVDRCYWDHRERFPSGYLRVSLDPDKLVVAADLAANLAERLKLPAGSDALAATLTAVPGLVHIENADTREAGRVVAAALAAMLPGCAVVVSARYRALGTGAGWNRVELLPFDEAGALAQLAAEPGMEAIDRGEWPALAAALGYLPLALHLAAGYLGDGDSVASFLRRLRAQNLSLTHIDPADPIFEQRSRALISDTFGLSLTALQAEGTADGAAWRAGFAALGHAPASGFGESLGAAVAGLAADAFADMALAARQLSLLDRVPRGAGHAYRLHPLLAELVRGESDREAASARMTEWFVARLPEGSEDDRGRRWGEVHEEFAALTEWLGQVSPGDRVRVERAGRNYAISNGPFHAWMRFCETMLAGKLGDAARSDALWTLGQMALRAGDPDRALAAAKEQRDLDNKRGAAREVALAAGLIADIIQMRGGLDEALRIRREEELPVYERLGDARSAAVTKGQIADIIQMRGDLDGALRIRREEQLPVYERLGDARSAAVTKGNIADILYRCGDLDEALRIRREEQLPVLEHLGDARAAAVAKWNIGLLLINRGHEGDRDEAAALLRAALDIARRLQLAEVPQLEEAMRQLGFDPGG
jgi:hypothetical protein